MFRLFLKELVLLFSMHFYYKAGKLDLLLFITDVLRLWGAIFKVKNLAILRIFAMS